MKSGVSDNMDDEKYLASVREQYENYPYPMREPENEKRGLFLTSTEHLGKISHYCYGGKRDLRQGGRFLVAGGGTGDAAIYLAEQLRDTCGEVVYLDLSARSMEIARQRAEVRGLDNISWHQCSLLELPDLGLGEFDYINCCGVLHHLADPALGLRVLAGALKSDGCMGLMVYAQYGRTAIYQVQELMRRINAGENDLQQCINNARAVLSELPDGNWYKRDESRWRETLAEFGDIEIFDLFLHSQDRAYTVPEVYQWVSDCDLNMVGFTGFTGHKLNYDYTRYFRDSRVLKCIAGMSVLQQQAIAEIANGCIKTHTFYVSRSANTVADIRDPDQVPFYAFPFAPCEVIFNDLSRAPDKSVTINFGGGVEPLVIPQSQHTRFIFKYLDGERAVKEILERAHQDIMSAGIGSLSPGDLMSELRAIFEEFNAYEMMFLRHASVGAYKRDDQLIQETLARYAPKPTMGDFVLKF